MWKPKVTFKSIRSTPLLTDDRPEVQRGAGTCPKLPRYFVAKPGPKFRFSSSQVLSFPPPLCPLNESLLLKSTHGWRSPTEVWQKALPVSRERLRLTRGVLSTLALRTVAFEAGAPELHQGAKASDGNIGGQTRVSLTY